MEEMNELTALRAVLNRPIPSPQGSLSQRQAAIVEPAESVVARNMDRWFHNPWTMIEDGVIYTLDQADMLNPIKRFPPNPWGQQIAYEWLTHKKLLEFKSRRQMQSWLFLFLHLHLAMFNEGASIYVVSQKEEKSDELLTRAEFMYKYIPDNVMLKPKMKRTYGWLEFLGLDSFMHGVAMGADQLRQYTATALFFDEFAFWEKARETYMASIPTIQGGGRVTIISSPMAGFFKDLCFDQMK
jgi:hypothetical protein